MPRLRAVRTLFVCPGISPYCLPEGAVGPVDPAAPRRCSSIDCDLDLGPYYLNGAGSPPELYLRTWLLTSRDRIISEG